MKITVQNGATHGLSRKEVEAMACLFPSSWSRSVKSITLYQGGTGITTKFYDSKGIMGLFWPATPTGHTKAQAIEALLLALAIVAERGALPEKIGSSLRSRMLDGIATLHQQCLSIGDINAV